jgi:SAC3 family protein LENG8/THP3
VNVYELHGRIALQCDDLNEYNQCQTQLKQLYSNGHGQLSSEMEFTAYRILYYLYLQGNSKYQKGNQDLAHIMSSLTSQAMRYFLLLPLSFH